MNQRLIDYNPEMESLEGLRPGPLAAVARRPASGPGVFNEGQLLELAAELLEARTPRKLADSIAHLVQRTARSLRAAASPEMAGALQQTLARVASQVLPHASGQHAGQARPAAARALGLELEGLSPEDKEFELAKQFVRLAADVVRHAVAAPAGQATTGLAQRALAAAA